MDNEAAREIACREYQSSLEDLTFNSKPHINMLTILADENFNFAKDIVAIIEAQIQKMSEGYCRPFSHHNNPIPQEKKYKASSSKKLPVLYLVDSIVKNVGREYLAAFSKNLITSFICVFEKVDENTRKSLFKLRSTWDEVFPLTKLYALDVRVNALDPAWPIKPLPPTANNPSIHINPRFLKQSDEPISPTLASPQPGSAATSPQLAVVGNPEQLIRQQLLAKQKQLLELQQKKIELELEQTKAQLAGGIANQSNAKPVNQTTNVVRPWIPPQPRNDSKTLTRDPRLNRISPTSAALPRDEQNLKKDGGDLAPILEKKLPEKPSRSDKPRPQKKDVIVDKLKSILPPTKSPNNKKAAESMDGSKKDPRLKKRLSEARNDDQKEKKRLTEKKDEVRGNKLLNGTMPQGENGEVKSEQKAVGIPRIHARKRSRSRSRSPNASPKRKGHRSPKNRPRSSSLSPSLKSAKPRRPRTADMYPSKSSKEEHLGNKDPPESWRKRVHSESREAPRKHDVGGKETKDSTHRWRSGWESKHLKSEDLHLKPGAQRHKSYSNPSPSGSHRPLAHRLSVDANLQIPEVLNSASKKDLLRRASERLESGEMSQEDFLNLVHQLKHLFQYQQEKQLQRSEDWGNIHDSSKVNHQPPGEELDKPTGVCDGDDDDPIKPHQFDPLPRDRSGERKRREHKDIPNGLMIEDYNHGKEFPTLKGLSGLRFRKKQDLSEASEREWNSPLTERQKMDEQKSGYDMSRRYASPNDPRNHDLRRPEGNKSHRSSPSRVGKKASRFDRERLSPIHQRDNLSSHFETMEHSGTVSLDGSQSMPNSILHGKLGSTHHQSDSPGHTPPHDEGHRSSRFTGPNRSRRHGWFNGNDPRMYGEHHLVPNRFDVGVPERQDGNSPNMHFNPALRFDGVPQGPCRFSGPNGQQPPPPPPVRFDGPLQRFNNMGPGDPMAFQQNTIHFENQMRFENPTLPDFNGPPPSQLDFIPQGPPRFPPQHNLQPPMRPLGPPVYNNPMAAQQNFGMGPQCFPESINPQFPGGPMVYPSQQPGNFNMQPPAFFNPTASGLQQPMMPNQPFLPPTSVPYLQQHPLVGPQEIQFRQVDVEDLLSKLISTGIITPSSSGSAPSTSETSPMAADGLHAEEDEEEDQETDDNIPDLTSFTISAMKIRYESVITKLYTGNQCCLCSMRFTAAQTDMYADHLDWHFRQNHAGKMAGKKVTHRRWYYDLMDWIEFEEIADLEERAKSEFFEKENEEVQKSQAAAKEVEVQTVRATKDRVGESCEICQEQFETYWVEDEEDWFLKNAVRVDEKNFHPSCFEDYQNMSSYSEVTPSPTKLTENPLAKFREYESEVVHSESNGSIKQEEEEEKERRTCCEIGRDVKVESEVFSNGVCSQVA